MKNIEEVYVYVRESRKALALTIGENAEAARSEFFACLISRALHKVFPDNECEALRRRIGDAGEESGLACAYARGTAGVNDALPDVPEFMCSSPLLIGWAFQFWNEPVRDRSSWAVSKREMKQPARARVDVLTQLFTDDYIADFICVRCIDLVAGADVPWPPRIMDPAVGAGHMLCAAIRVLHARGVPLEEIVSKLWGCDVDPDVVTLARLLVILTFGQLGYNGNLVDVWNGLVRTLVVLPSPAGTLDREAAEAAGISECEVVVTNPPYLGRRKLDIPMRAFLDQQYPAARVDLSAAFIQRCVELTARGGALGFVTSETWLRLRGYTALREGGAGFSGLLRELSFDIVCELGERAFHPIVALHDGLKASIVCGQRLPPKDDHTCTVMRLGSYESYQDKVRALEQCRVAGTHNGRVLSIRQVDFFEGRSSAMFLESHELPRKLIDAHTTVADYADVVVGVQTSDDGHFVRYHWEVPPDRDMWRIHSKGGGYGRWAGMNRWVIQWPKTGGMFFKTQKAESLALEWAARPGWTYTWFANGSLGLRQKQAGWSFGRAAASGVFCRDERIVSVLNSRITSLACRALGGKIQLPEGIVRRVPVSDDLSCISLVLQSAAVALRHEMLRNDITDVLFDDSVTSQWFDDLVSEALILCVEGVLEHQVEQSLQMSDGEVRRIAEVAGVPVAWFPSNYNLNDHPLWGVVPQRWQYVRNELNRALFDRGPLSGGVGRRDNATLRRVVLGESLDCSRRYALPPVSWLEKVSRMVECHPFDVAMFCIQTSDECPQIRRALAIDWIHGQVVRELLVSLGHRWWSSSARQPSGVCSEVSFADVEALAQSYHSKIGVEYLPPTRKSWVDRVFAPWQKRRFFGRSPLHFEVGAKSSGRIRHMWTARQGMTQPEHHCHMSP